ncbi:MAG: cytidylate kinase-like family protein [Roseburia sp.]|nr:cytidylate kinase-like family protein [Roseburia sp.]
MDKQIIISISREFGSGGHAIADQIAKEMELPLYDRSILEDIANEKGIDKEYLEKFDERPKVPLVSRRVRGHSNSMEENLAEMQFEYLKKKAENGESFVVVGRCAETILKDQKGLISIFVLADRLDKISRVEQQYQLSEKEAVAKINRHDRKRKYYHNRYSQYRWGDSRSYDLCVNSSRLGIRGTAKMLRDYLDTRIEAE